MTFEKVIKDSIQKLIYTQSIPGTGDFSQTIIKMYLQNSLNQPVNTELSVSLHASGSALISIIDSLSILCSKSTSDC